MIQILLKSIFWMATPLWDSPLIAVRGGMITRDYLLGVVFCLLCVSQVEALDQPAKALSDIALEDASRADTTRYAALQEKKIEMQAVMADCIMNVFDQSNHFTMPIGREDQDTEISNHFKTMILVKKIAKKRAMQLVGAFDFGEVLDIANIFEINTLSLREDYNELNRISGIDQGLFNRWFKEVFDDHKTVFVENVAQPYRITQRVGNVTFVLEKVTSDTAEKWRDFANDQKDRQCVKAQPYFDRNVAPVKEEISKIYDEMWDIVPSSYFKEQKGMIEALGFDQKKRYSELEAMLANKMKVLSENSMYYNLIERREIDIRGAIGSFKRVMIITFSAEENRHVYVTEPTQLWVAYVTHQDDISNNRSLVNFSEIEVCVTVRTTPCLIGTTHFGAFRTDFPFDSIDENRLIIKNLSMPLHGFAAKMLTEILPDKKVMYTKPLAAMTEMMKKSLPVDAIKYHGSVAALYKSRSLYDLLYASTYLNTVDGAHDSVSIKLDALANCFDSYIKRAIH